MRWLTDESHCSDYAARQALTYVAAQHAAIGLVPTQTRVVFERFFDESGGMQLVVHAPFGGRINRAWGLAMRKRFCRSFDFELQASADDDGFILSLGPQHSFPIESLFGMLRPDNVRNLLEQALLAVPTFHLRWRWNATRALQVARQRNGKKVPPALQRFRSEDLLTAVFPKLTGCQENITGDHEIPDHPLIHQTVDDCLHEALDLDGLLNVLRCVESGELTFVPRDTREPSPFAYELLNANPYAFLDGGEIQERRARAVATRRSLTIDSVRNLGRLDPAAIEQVIAEAQPLVRSADELHDVLLSRILLPVSEQSVVSDEGMRRSGAEEISKNTPAPAPSPHRLIPSSPHPQHFFEELTCAGRAATVHYARTRTACVAAERWPAVLAMFPDAVATPPLVVPDTVRDEWTSIDARVAAVRGLVDVCGPATAQEVADLIGITPEQAFAALEALEGEGTVLRGHFCEQRGDQNTDLSTTDVPTLNAPLSTLDSPEWCHRRLLARIHRLTMAGLRREIEPVDVPTYVRFLFRHHGATSEARRSGANGLFETLGQLQGLDIPAVAWERDILPLRLSPYRGEWLDELCLTGEAGWGRLYPPLRDPQKSRPMASITRVAPVSIFLRDDLWWLAGADDESVPDLSSPAQQVLELLHSGGAMFATDLLAESGLLPAQLDDVLGELVSRGLLTSDGFAGLRNLVRVTASGESSPANGRGPKTVRRRSTSSAGRWSLWRRKQTVGANSPDAPLGHLAGPAKSDSRSLLREVVEHWAWQLLRRWGVVFKDLLRRESGAPAWYELLQVYRRLEARGEIRGGRFVAGVAGEQFALGDTVRELRRLRDEPAGSEVVVVSAADPLNLVGVIDGEDRIAASASNRVAFAGGSPVAAIQAGELTWLRACAAEVLPGVLERLGLQRERPDDPPPEAVPTQQFEGPSDRDGTAESRRRKRPRVRSGIPRPRIS